VHDYFEILGVARNARPGDIRRACCRRAHASHPDVWDGDAGKGRTRDAISAPDPRTADEHDAAVDFVDVATVIDAMRAAFFASPQPDTAFDR
jgi:hypothetical protein